MSLAAAFLAGLHILFVGDSITGGSGARQDAGFVSHVREARPEWRIEVASCDGSSSSDWLDDTAADDCSVSGAFVSEAVAHRDAAVVHILLGTNDATGFMGDAPVTPERYLANIDALARRFSGDVIVSLPPPVSRPHSHEQKRLRRYRRVLLDRAAEEDAPFRIGADFGGLDREHVRRLHPDGTGHAWMARRLLRALEALEPPPGKKAAKPRSDDEDDDA